MASTKQVDANPFHKNRWPQIVRMGWYGAATMAAGILIASIPGYIQRLWGVPINGTWTYELTPTLFTFNLIAALISISIALLCLILAILLFRRRPNDNMARFLSFYLLGHGILVAGPVEALEPFLPGIADLNTFLIQPLVTVPMAFAILGLFPDGRFVPSWARWMALSSFLIGPISYYLAYQAIRDLTHPMLMFVSLLFLGITISMVYAQIYRYRHVSTIEQRQQTKWVLYGIALWFCLLLISTAIFIPLQTMPPGSRLPWWGPLSAVCWTLSTGFFPISLTVALTRHRLFDIDLLINRTLVYAALTASVVGLYVLIVGGAGLMIQTNLKLAGLLITVVLAGVIYRPMRAFFQRGADQIVRPALNPSVTYSGERVLGPIFVTAHATEAEQTKFRKWGRVLKPLWVTAAVVSVAILIASLPGYLLRTPIGNLGSHLVFQPTPLILGIHHLNSLLSILAAILSLSLAGLIFVKKPSDRMALFLSFYLLAHGILFAGPIEMLEPFWPDAARVNSFILLPIFTGPATAALFGLFPDGRFVPRWSRWLIAATLLVFPTSLLIERGGLPSGSGPLGWSLIGVIIILSIAVFIALLYVPIYRYRYVSTPEQRQQTKWVVYGIFLWFVFLLISGVPWMMVLNLPPGSLIPWWLPVAQLFWVISTAIFPVTLTIAVMRYRLYDIDILINRTLVYGALSASVAVIYILVVGAFGVLFQLGGNLIISLLATGLVAVVFQPLRARLQRGINRLMYGERDDPAEVFSRLGELLEASGSPQEMLPGLVLTIAQTLKLPYAAIELGRGARREVVAEHGQLSGKPERFPLVYQSEVIGSLVAAPRSPGEDFADADRRLLGNIARQAGAVAHAVQLTNELQRSRARLVTAREEERRRLRRDLHDELGPQLASQTLIIEALEKRMRQDPTSAAQLLEELKKQSRRAVQDIRQIVYDLRPPALDNLGLAGALRESLASYRRSGVDFQLEAAEPLPALPAAVEVAAYRIVQEAITNVVRHAEAKRCTVSIEYEEADENTALRLRVEDDGNGLKGNRPHGVGLTSIRERATELGGDFTLDSGSKNGTRLCVRLPITREGQ